VKLFFDGKSFFVECTFDERFLPSAAKFTWDVVKKKWTTKEISKAVKLSDYAAPCAKKELEKNTIQIKDVGETPFPEKLSPREYQLKAAKFLAARNRAYANMEPGTGKSIVAALVINYLNSFLKHAHKTLYICPPFLIENMKKEFEKWVIGHHKISTLSENYGTNVLLIPDSMIGKKEVQNLIKDFAKSFECTVFYDEAHRIKELSSARSKAFYGQILPIFTRAYLMSGTAMPNRPMELFAPLSYLAPECIGFKNKFEYGRRYCAGHQGRFGWDFTGASNLDELRENMKPFMLTIKKQDVLKELPAKTEELVLVGEKLPQKLAALDKEILNTYSPRDLMKSSIALRMNKGSSELHIATYRKELGIAKVGHVRNFIEHLLESTKESLLVFAIHKEVIAKLKNELDDYKPLVITGDTPMQERSKIVNAFQKGESRIFIGNIQASGTGFTMTKASRVVFAESSWVPAENLQAMDRAHRIGQNENVLVHYLVFKHSVDATVMQAVLSKKEITERI
jgi:SWI/SNF-related matrix-associated actin-dependent regulator 1 of chromatin subfamily A